MHRSQKGVNTALQKANGTTYRGRHRSSRTPPSMAAPGLPGGCNTGNSSSGRTIVRLTSSRCLSLTLAKPISLASGSAPLPPDIWTGSLHTNAGTRERNKAWRYAQEAFFFLTFGNVHAVNPVGRSAQLF